MYSLIFRFLPYLLIPAGLSGIILGAVVVADPPPESPTQTTLTELMDGAPDAAPDWIEVGDGYLDWAVVGTITSTRKGTTKPAESIVPYVPAEFLPGNYEDAPVAGKTCIAVKFSHAEIEREWPQIAQAIDRAVQEDVPVEIPQHLLSTAPYALAGTTSRPSSGLEGGALKDLVKAGFSGGVLVSAGGTPLTSAAGFGLIGGGAVLGVVGLLWSRKRLAKPTVTAVDDDDALAPA